MIGDLRYVKLFPKQYKTSEKRTKAYWRDVEKSYDNLKKKIECSGYHWYVITYKDVRKELAYLRISRIILPKEGRLCRGLIIPRHWTIKQYEHVKYIRLAF